MDAVLLFPKTGPSSANTTSHRKLGLGLLSAIDWKGIGIAVTLESKSADPLSAMTNEKTIIHSPRDGHLTAHHSISVLDR